MPYDLNHQFLGTDIRGNLRWENPYAPDQGLKTYIESPEIFISTLPDVLSDPSVNMPFDIALAMSHVDIEVETVTFANDNI